jgi:hypothetical protein
MNESPRSFWSSPGGLAALGLIGAVSYFLLMEHRQHLFAALPYLIVLACPVMHLFMHRGHRSHGHGGSRNGAQSSQRLDDRSGR